MSTPNAPPTPAPGSARYFALLYTPAPLRKALAALLAVGDELAAGLQRGLDHGVAHLRLQWWEEELARLQQGAARHPWLADWPPSQRAPDLRALAQAAAIDLASHRLAARQELQLQAALFVSAAQLLGAPVNAGPGAAADAGPGMGPRHDAEPLSESVRAMGRWAGTLQAAAAGEAWAQAQVPRLLSSLRERQEGALVEPVFQPALMPLLVWLGVLVHQCRRAQRRGKRAATPAPAQAKSATMPPLQRTGRLDGLADNFIAWRYARAAVRRRFRVDIG